MEQEVYIDKISREYNISKEAIYAEINKLNYANNQGKKTLENKFKPRTIKKQEDGLTKVDVTFDNETVWLSLDQIANLFQRDKSTISRHIKNVFEEGELERNSVVANFATTSENAI